MRFSTTPLYSWWNWRLSQRAATISTGRDTLAKSAGRRLSATDVDKSRGDYGAGFAQHDPGVHFAKNSLMAVLPGDGDVVVAQVVSSWPRLPRIR